MLDLPLADQFPARAFDLQFTGAEDFEGLLQGLGVAPLLGVHLTATLRALLPRTSRGAKACRPRHSSISRRRGHPLRRPGLAAALATLGAGPVSSSN